MERILLLLCGCLTGHEFDRAMGSIRDLSNILDHRGAFLEMDEDFVSEIEASVIAVIIMIWQKMEQSPLMQGLQRHTALFALAKRFMAMHLTVVPDILDLSSTLTGDLAKRFEIFLEHRCGKMGGVHTVYKAEFSPNNEYGLPDGTCIVKTFAPTPPPPPMPPRIHFKTNPMFLSEYYYLERLRPYQIAADIIARAENDDIQCVVLRYYPQGDLLSKVQDTNLTWHEALRILIRISYIFHVIHTVKVVYQDVKPENFLLDGDDIIICDLASMCFEGCQATIDTNPYKEEVPDGVQAGKRYAHQKGDIFKLGQLIIAFLTTIILRDPITGDMVLNLRGIVTNTIDEPLDHFMRPKMLSPDRQENHVREIIGLVIQCLDPNPENRPTADVIADTLYAIKQQSIG